MNSRTPERSAIIADVRSLGSPNFRRTRSHDGAITAIGYGRPLPTTKLAVVGDANRDAADRLADAAVANRIDGVEGHGRRGLGETVALADGDPHSGEGERDVAVEWRTSAGEEPEPIESQGRRDLGKHELACERVPHAQERRGF